MNVLMLCALDVWSLAQGQGAPTLDRTLRAYGEAGHRVHVIAPTVGANRLNIGRGRGAQQPPAIVNVSFERFHVPGLADLPVPVPPLVAKADQKLRFALLYPRMAARRADAALRRQPFDVLYGYEVHGVLAMRRLRSALPRVARFQGTVMHPALRSRLAYYRKYEEVLALRTPAGLYVMTDDGTQGDEVLARLNPQSAGRVRFWRNGLDLDRLRPPSDEERAASRRALGLAPDEFVAVMVTRLARWKRVDRAIEAWPLVRRALPNAKLLIAGDGEERARLEAQASRLGLRDAVRFTGSVPQADVQRYLWAADVFLSLNELSNVGNPLLEALACGSTVVTINVGDTRDVVEDGVTGRLLPSGDAETVATAVIELARDQSTRCRLGAEARRFAEERFWTWEQRLAAEIAAVEALVGLRR